METILIGAACFIFFLVNRITKFEEILKNPFSTSSYYLNRLLFDSN